MSSAMYPIEESREEDRRMARCNEFCTKEATGTCALCEARAEADRFVRFWFMGGWLMDGVRALKSKGVFAYFSSSFSLPWHTRLMLSIVGLLLGLIISWVFWAVPPHELASEKLAAAQ